MHRRSDQSWRPDFVRSPTPLPRLASLPSKALDFLSVFTGDDKPLPADALSYPPPGFPDRPCPGSAVAHAALYGHDQGDRKRIFKRLSFALTNIPRRGYLLNSDAERMPVGSWWCLTERRQRLLLSMTSQVLADLLRPAWLLEAVKEEKRVDLDQLRRKRSFSGEMLSSLAGLEYGENGNAAGDLRELVETGVLKRHNHGFLPDRWPPDADVRPMTIDEILHAANVSKRFFGRRSKARDRALKKLGVPVPPPRWTYVLQGGIWVAALEPGFAP